MALIQVDRLVDYLEHHTKLSSGELSAAPLKMSILQYLKMPSFSARIIVKNHLSLGCKLLGSNVPEVFLEESRVES